MQHRTVQPKQFKPLRLSAITDALSRNWFNGLLIGLGIYILFFKDISVQFKLNSIESAVPVEQLQSVQPQAQPTALHSPLPPQNVAQTKAWDSRSESDFPNLTFVLSPDYEQRHRVRPEIVAAKAAKIEAYVERHQALAISSMEAIGIPASITLAQGLLESNAGESKLATESNNHFGIKCRSQCRGCTCRNYADDDVYDMFRVFASAEESFGEHAELLKSGRYRHLLKLRVTDYAGWARGLKKAGYATDKRYAEKLIQIIESLDLGRFDRLGA